MNLATIVRWAIPLIFVTMVTSATTARSEAADTSRWSAHAGGGFTLSPDTALLAVGLDYAIAPQLALGPLVQFGVDDNDTIVAPTANFRYRIDLSNADDAIVRRIEPYVQGGAGIAYVERDRGRRDRDDAEFMLNGGVGLDFRVAPKLSVGSAVLFNGMPVDDAAGERFFFSWQLLTARVHF
jgi:hypothetical protein